MTEHKQIQWPERLKKTKQRVEVVEALYKAEKPLSVQEISAVLLREGNPLWLSTIYRALESLAKHGVIQKSAVHENGTALYEIGGNHRHYAVCVDCKCIVEVKGCPIEVFFPELQAKSFHVVGHNLQISGVCGDCYMKKAHEPENI